MGFIVILAKEELNLKMNPKWIVHEDKNYEAWIRTKPCVACISTPVDCHHVYHARRNSYLSVPLCRTHHTAGAAAYHHLEHDKFEEVHNLDLGWEIIKLLGEYLELVTSSKKVYTLK